jgi:hypothetical protein
MPVFGTAGCLAVFILLVEVFDIEFLQHRADLFLGVKGHILFISPLLFFHFNACRNFSATVRRDLMRAKYLSLASTSVQGESGVLVFKSISSAAVM